MTDTNELRRLRAAATGKYWERYGNIGSGGLAKVRCPSGCDRVGRQIYTEIPSSGDDAKLICYLANSANDIADELDALRADVAKLTTERDALRELLERNCDAIRGLNCECAPLADAITTQGTDHA